MMFIVVSYCLGEHLCELLGTSNEISNEKVMVVVLGVYVPPTAKIIRRRDQGLTSHPKYWRNPGSIMIE